MDSDLLPQELFRPNPKLNLKLLLMSVWDIKKIKGLGQSQVKCLLLDHIGSESGAAITVGPMSCISAVIAVGSAIVDSSERGESRLD